MDLTVVLCLVLGFIMQYCRKKGRIAIFYKCKHIADTCVTARITTSGPFLLMSSMARGSQKLKIKFLLNINYKTKSVQKYGTSLEILYTTMYKQGSISIR